MGQPICASFNLGIVVVVTLIPIVVFGVGLGLLPALIIAYYAGRKQITQSIPYMEVRDLAVKGCNGSTLSGGRSHSR